MGPVPEIDVAALVELDDPGRPLPTAAARAAAAIDEACRETGFFTVVGHGTNPAALAELDRLARDFFALPEATKARLAMARGGRAWRGWFPVGGELTSGVPDRKEGIYFGAELGPEDPRVVAGLPLHGANLFPDEPAGLRAAVLAHLEAMTRVGQAVLVGMAVGLGLEADWFARHLTADPIVLFRIFRYPPSGASPAAAVTGPWGVAEHTDYGLVTLLAQDGTPGLEVRTVDGWVPVDPRPDRLVCNLGDMLERLTGGRYRSTPHRVRNDTTGDRLSFPFFLDPSWDATVDALPLDDAFDPVPDHVATDRWDGASVHDLGGTYGEYLTAKVAKVFPELADGAGSAIDRSTR